MATQKNEVAGKVLSLYPEQLRIRKNWNVRTDMGDMKQLQNSIAENGIESPVKAIKTKDVTEDNYPVYEVVVGHRRVQAAKTITEKTGEHVMIPTVEVEADSTEYDLIGKMLTDMGSKELSLLERAYGMQRMKKAYAEEHEGKEMKDSEVARKLGVSQPHVADCMLLLKANKETLAQVKSGAISASTIIEAMKAADPDEVDTHLEKAVAKAEKSGKETISKKDLEAAAGKSLSKKGGAAARSTKEGAPETNGPIERPSKMGQALNMLISLQDALNSEEDRADDRNPVAFATLAGCIGFLNGSVQTAELADVFFSDGSNLPAFAAPADEDALLTEDEEAEVEETVAKIVTAPAKAKGKSLKEKFAEIEDEEKGGKKKTPAKKAAAPAAASTPKKSAAKKAPVDLDEDEDEAEEAPAPVVAKKSAAKKAAPAPIEEDEDDDLFEDEDDDIL